jgi:signal transduction histidine kinase
MAPGIGGGYSPEQPRRPDEFDERIVLLLHRLRTPLTTMKGWAEMAERQASTGIPAASLLPHLGHVLESIRQLQGEIDALAAEVHARAEATPHQPASAPIAEGGGELSEPRSSEPSSP